MKSKIVSKKVVKKIEVVDKKKVISKKTAKKDKVIGKKKATGEGKIKWGEGENSLVSEKNGKCLISFPIQEWASDAIDGDLGLIAALWFKKIHNTNIRIRPAGVWEGGRKAEALIYEFDKKNTKEIKATERDYFAGKIKTDAKTMSDLIMYEINYLSPKGWREALTEGEEVEDKEE